MSAPQIATEHQYAQAYWQGDSSPNSGSSLPYITLSTETAVATMQCYTTILQRLGTWILAFGLLMPFSATAAEVGPGVIVKDSTDRIMALVDEAIDYFDDDPERFFDAMGAELDKVVDFRGFARGVMGDYASSARYRTLDAAGREALKAQLDAFTVALRQGLINTYSRGLLAFGGARTELASTDFSPDSSRVASVTQRVFSPEGNVYSIRYQMGQYKDGSWKLRNLIIENINLGEIYRGQFEAAVEAADGDIDYVISHWDEASVRVENKESTDGSQ